MNFKPFLGWFGGVKSWIVLNENHFRHWINNFSPTFLACSSCSLQYWSKIFLQHLLLVVLSIHVYLHQHHMQVGVASRAHSHPYHDLCWELDKFCIWNLITLFCPDDIIFQFGGENRTNGLLSEKRTHSQSLEVHFSLSLQTLNLIFLCFSVIFYFFCLVKFWAPNFFTRYWWNVFLEQLYSFIESLFARFCSNFPPFAKNASSKNSGIFVSWLLWWDLAASEWPSPLFSFFHLYWMVLTEKPNVSATSWTFFQAISRPIASLYVTNQAKPQLQDIVNWDSTWNY